MHLSRSASITMATRVYSVCGHRIQPYRARHMTIDLHGSRADHCHCEHVLFNMQGMFSPMSSVDYVSSVSRALPLCNSAMGIVIHGNWVSFIGNNM